MSRFLVEKIETVNPLFNPIPDGLYTQVSKLNTSMPEYAGYVDALKFGADPTGQKESTSSIQAAIAVADGKRPVWVPRGIYWINPLFWGNKSYNHLMGESELETIFLVKEGSQTFQDPNNQTALFNSGYQNNTYNQAFANQFQNFTIICEKNNPGFIGFNYLTANNGGIKNVSIKCEGIARTAIKLNLPDFCCGVLDNIKIVGQFRFGIETNHYSDNLVIHRLYLEGIREAGIQTDNTLHITISNLESRLNCPVLNTVGGSTEIIDSKVVYTGSGNQTAFVDANLWDNFWQGARCYFKNVDIQGYSQAYEHRTNPSLNIQTINPNQEATSFPKFSNNPNSTGFLPEISTDSYPELEPYHYAFSEWVFAGVPNGYDDHSTIQTQINNNLDKKVICFNGGYNIRTPIDIPKESRLKVILGYCFLKPQSGNGYYNNSSSPNPIFYIGGESGVVNTSPILIRGFEGYIFDVPSRTADFIHNLFGRTLIVEETSSSYVRQIGGKHYSKQTVGGKTFNNVTALVIGENPEGNEVGVYNGSKAKIIGSKTESNYGSVYVVIANSELLMIGNHHLGNETPQTNVALFEVDSTSKFGFVGITGQQSHDVILREQNFADLKYSNLPNQYKPFPSTWKMHATNN